MEGGRRKTRKAKRPPKQCHPRVSEASPNGCLPVEVLEKVARKNGISGPKESLLTNVSKVIGIAPHNQSSLLKALPLPEDEKRRLARQWLRPEMPASEREVRVRKLLQRVELPEEAMYRYPHEFSGGQRQRICIARALAVEPKVIICDEPTSALDVSVQSQIIQLLKTLQVEQGMSYLFITHDLAVVSEIADEVAVMYRGKIVEQGAVAQILTQPQHAYTQKLISAIPCAVN
jgi:ABC-type oligopeptide transport system ATPase subunit